jgi:cysteine desulfurase
MKPIYLDYNASTPIAKEVADAMRPFLEGHFGNPSSAHIYGAEAKSAVEKARWQIARLLNCEISEIVFTSGGTESNNYAIKGIAFAHKIKGNHIITSSVEHPAVLEVCYYLRDNHSFDITILPVDKYGIVSAHDVEKAITSNTILITIMHANNEVGSIQPIMEISKIAQKHDVYFHTDAAQSVGKIPVDVKEMGVDLLSLAGHKLYAPKGVGVLYIKDGTRLEKLIHGANHEQNLRAGTENVLEIVGLGKACELASLNRREDAAYYGKMASLLYQLLKDALPEIQLNGHPSLRLPNTLNIAFPKIPADALLSRLKGLVASAGAACHGNDISISPVLSAMKIPSEIAMGAVRFSTGRETTEAQIRDAAIEIISTLARFENEILKKL